MSDKNIHKLLIVSAFIFLFLSLIRVMFLVAETVFSVLIWVEVFSFLFFLIIHNVSLNKDEKKNLFFLRVYGNRKTIVSQWIRQNECIRMAIGS